MSEVEKPLYSLEIYKDHALISGWLTTDMLTVLIRLCKKHGFTHLCMQSDQEGFKLVKAK